MNKLGPIPEPWIMIAVTDFQLVRTPPQETADPQCNARFLPSQDFAIFEKE